jgi:hypothetical protein
MLKYGWKTIVGFILYAVAGGLGYLQMYELSEAVRQLAEALIGVGVVHKLMKGQLGSNPLE